MRQRLFPFVSLGLSILLSQMCTTIETNSGPMEATFCDPKHCHCDHLCNYYGDCCAQTVSRTSSANREVNLFHCVNGRYVTNKCPPHFPDKDIRRSCEESQLQDGIDYFLYVYSSDNRLFKNAYCAYCNDFPNYEKVNVTSISCRTNRNRFGTFKQTLSLLISGECYLEFDFGEAYSRSCYGGVTTDCLSDASLLQVEHCETSPTWYVFHETGMVFRNEQCCSCNNFTCSNDSSGVGPGFMNSGASYRTYLNFYEWCGESCEAKVDISSNITTPQSNATDSRSVYDTVIADLTLIFSILSLLTLIMLILAYATIKELQNFGGLLTICLSLSIFLTQLLTLFTEISQKSKGACKFIAISLHFFFLSSFIWMSLFAFDLIKTFYTRSASPNSIYVKLMKFAAVAIGCPALIILIGLLLDILAPTFVISPHYGVKICWFNQMWAGLTWFFIPVAILLLFNVLACVAAFMHLFKTARETRHVRDQNGPSFSRSMFFLVLKITTLFGVFWLMQLMSVFTRSIVLMDVIGLVNSLQGCFIGICFLATKRVKRAAKSSFSKLTSSNVFKSSSQAVSNTHHES